MTLPRSLLYTTTILTITFTKSWQFIDAFSPRVHTSCMKYTKPRTEAGGTTVMNAINRRTFVAEKIAKLVIIPVATVSFTTASLPPSTAWATLMDPSKEDIEIFTSGKKLSVETAKQRFKGAMEDIDELLKNYDDISSGGNNGDNVRRYLGTVGVKSRMYGIRKVLKNLREEADIVDIVEFTEASNEFEAYLNLAEGAAYQSLFVEHSSAKGTPASLLATAKMDVVMMRKFMGELADQLNL